MSKLPCLDACCLATTHIHPGWFLFCLFSLFVAGAERRLGWRRLNYMHVYIMYLHTSTVRPLLFIPSSDSVYTFFVLFHFYVSLMYHSWATVLLIWNRLLSPHTRAMPVRLVILRSPHLCMEPHFLNYTINHCDSATLFKMYLLLWYSVDLSLKALQRAEEQNHKNRATRDRMSAAALTM